jgi:hypothetical protein
VKGKVDAFGLPASKEITPGVLSSGNRLRTDSRIHLLVSPRKEDEMTYWATAFALSRDRKGNYCSTRLGGASLAIPVSGSANVEILTR